MAVKFSVSLPDELYAEYEQWLKGSISPTKVFQEAIEARINKRKETQRRVDAMSAREEIIARLRKQKEAEEADIAYKGETEGLEFAKTADYGELKYAATVWAESYQPWRDGHFNDSPLRSYFNGLNELEGLDEEEADEWHRGWCYGVKCFWEDVSKDL